MHPATLKYDLYLFLCRYIIILNSQFPDFSTRFRRATHVTPKSYLNFIAGYKNIYQLKQQELGEGAQRMETGLRKLDEASRSVEILKKDLAVMEQELALASEKAERVGRLFIFLVLIGCAKFCY